MESKYRMGYLLVIFDLPVTKKVESRAAQKFRQFLLNDGYLMVQFSVYLRPCVNVDHVKKHARRIQKVAPQTGFVKVLFFTDRQWALGVDIFGQPSSFEWHNRIRSEDVPSLMEFW